MTVLDRASNIGIYRKQILHATHIKSCTKCGAPGYYHDVPGVNVGCYDPARKMQPVGSICPNCQAPRPEPETPLGVIWSKHFYPPGTPKWLMRILEWINGKPA